MDKLDRDKIEIDLKTVNLRDFTNEISSIIRLLAQDKNLTFQSEIIEPIPVAIEADGTRLRQVLWNILFNALKFTPKGEVTLVVEARDEGAGNSTVTFRINDTGVGIPQDDIDKIFAMYYQVDHPDHQSATGTGIGLAICKQMVDKMNGDIRVHSVVGQGTCFEIVLPVAISKQQARMAELEVSNLNILLVEDIELNVMVAKALLEKLGQRVEVAMTGTAAIEMARKTQYDLILLDIQLPDMTGFDVARTLHDEELVLQTPIVALTANVIKKREEYLQNGMDDIIAKPIKKSRVIEVFNELFGEDQLQSERPSASEVVSIPKVDKILDIDMLQMLIDTIGEDMVRTSLGVFQELSLIHI